MHKILLAFDGSESALRYVIALAKENGPISIHLVHAHEAPLVYGEIGMYVSDEKLAELQYLHSERVIEGAENLLREAGVPYTKEILTGPIASTIAKRAGDLGCQNIVMGTRGMTAIGNLVLGSVATKVIHFANAPVTLVK